MVMNRIDLNNLRITKVENEARASVIEDELSNKIPQHKRGERFLRGPIPCDWLTVAANLPGKAFNIGIAIWFWVRIHKSVTIRLNLSRLEQWGLSRHSAARGLEHLRKAGLVLVDRHSGRRAKITLLAVSKSAKDSGGDSKGVAHE